jgi:Bacterial SH3 domain
MRLADYGENSTSCEDELPARAFPLRFPPRFKLTCPPLAPSEEPLSPFRPKFETTVQKHTEGAVRPQQFANPPPAPGEGPSGPAFRGNVEVASKLLSGSPPQKPRLSTNNLSGEAKTNRKLRAGKALAGFLIVAGLGLSGFAYFFIPSSDHIAKDIPRTEELAEPVRVVGVQTAESATHPAPAAPVEQSEPAIRPQATTPEPVQQSPDDSAATPRLSQLASITWPEASTSITAQPSSFSNKASTEDAPARVAEAPVRNARAAPGTNDREIQSPASASQKRQVLYSRSGVNIRATPSSTAEVVGSVPKGTRFEVTTSNNGWAQVDNGRVKGWIYGRLLGPDQP